MTGRPGAETRLVAATRGGAGLAARAARLWPGCQVLAGPAAEPPLAEAGVPYRPVARGGLGEAIGASWERGGRIVCFLSVGATVRLIAPWLCGKGADPGVIAVDEGGRFVVPVLGGHRGGANDAAERLAAELGAVPVWTTASEAVGVPSPDLLGADQGWRVEASEAALRRAAGALVNGEPVALIEEGDRWQPDAAPPAHLQRLPDAGSLDPAQYAAVLWVRGEPVPEAWRSVLQDRLVVYRPPEGRAA